MHHARARYCMEAAVAPHGLDRFSSARSFRFHHTCGVCTRFEKVQTGGTYLRRPLHSGRRKVGTPFGTPCFLGVLASEAQALLARSLYEMAAGSSLSVRHERAADMLIPI